VDDPVNRNESCDAAAQHEGRSYKGRSQSARRIETAMASESHHDISLKIHWPPSSQTASNFRYHGYFQKTTADSA